jgi:hypothetical protein
MKSFFLKLTDWLIIKTLAPDSEMLDTAVRKTLGDKAQCHLSY